MTPIQHWPGQRVWLMGASSGIGAALAEALARQGATLILSARRADALAAQAERCTRLAPPGTPAPCCLPCNVQDSASLQQAVAQLRQQGIGVDLALYLAGDYTPMRAWELDLPEAERLLDINFTGAMRFTHSLLPLLQAQGRGTLGFVASVAGYRGLPQALAYGASKAALIHFAETLAIDLHPQGIAVRLINPGFVATRLTDQNRFAMPALLTPQQAATAIISGLAGEAFEIDFPKRFSRFLKLLGWLPDTLYFAAIRRFTGL